jgi:hypothetical protein
MTFRSKIAVGIISVAVIGSGVLLSFSRPWEQKPLPSLPPKVDQPKQEEPKKNEQKKPEERPVEDLIRVAQPRPDDVVVSPLIIRGEARGFWYFEASFPVRLVDANGKQLAIGIAQAQGEWMTEEFVSFQVALEFSKPATETGILILEKDNPSGDPARAAELRIAVRFAGQGTKAKAQTPSAQAKPTPPKQRADSTVNVQEKQKPCMATGCSGEVCADEPVFSACMVLPHYSCFATARCERQSDGECGWTQTPELKQCFEERGDSRDIPY